MSSSLNRADSVRNSEDLEVQVAVYIALPPAQFLQFLGGRESWVASWTCWTTLPLGMPFTKANWPACQACSARAECVGTGLCLLGEGHQQALHVLQ